MKMAILFVQYDPWMPRKPLEPPGFDHHGNQTDLIVRPIEQAEAILANMEKTARRSGWPFIYTLEAGDYYTCLFDGETAERLIGALESRFIFVEVIDLKRDTLNGWESLKFQHRGQIYTALCDTRYEGVFFLTPREESTDGKEA